MPRIGECFNLGMVRVKIFHSEVSQSISVQIEPDYNESFGKWFVDAETAIVSTLDYCSSSQQVITCGNCKIVTVRSSCLFQSSLQIFIGTRDLRSARLTKVPQLPHYKTL